MAHQSLSRSESEDAILPVVCLDCSGSFLVRASGRNSCLEHLRMTIGRLLLGVLMFCAAPHAWAQKVDVDWDRSTDFSKLKTYAWLESKHPAQGLWNQRIIDGVDAKLATAGWKKVDPVAHPDLEVVYNSGVREHTVVEGYDYGYGPWWWYGPRGPRQYQSYVEKQATLVVDMIDLSTKEMVWRATARDTLADSSDKNIKTLNKAMDKMFKNFPPKKK